MILHIFQVLELFAPVSKEHRTLQMTTESSKHSCFINRTSTHICIKFHSPGREKNNSCSLEGLSSIFSYYIFGLSLLLISYSTSASVSQMCNADAD